MMTTTTKVELPPSDLGTNKTTLPPTRSYELPGGPYRRGLPPAEVKILAEIERGGPDDRGCGSRR